MNWNQLKENSNKLIFGDDEKFDVQKRIFLLITHISIIIGFIGLVVNVTLGLGLVLTLATIIAVIFLGILHFLVRKNGIKSIHSISLFTISVLVFSALWFFNGGYDGNNGVLIFVYFIVMITVLPQNYRILAFVVYSLMIFSLVTLQFFNPEWVILYKFENQRYIDLALGYFLYFILAYVIQVTILKNYEKERENVNKSNDQLSHLVNQINEANKKLEETLTQVEDLNATKDRFITVLSHDLRSPFQGLLGITNTLENQYESFDEIEKRQYIFQVNNSLNKLYTFLEQLLVWGKLQQGAIKLKHELYTINELVEESVYVLAEMAVRKKIHLEKELTPNLSVIVDKEMILTVLRNLLSNAIKFSPIGSSVKIISFQKNNNVYLSIVDKGIGMSEESIEKLFKLDKIVSTPGTDGELGSGMGLILSYDIIKKHNGNLTVESKEGKGSAFTICLPHQ